MRLKAQLTISVKVNGMTDEEDKDTKDAFQAFVTAMSEIVGHTLYEIHVVGPVEVD